jgi:hypothetical protein
MTSPTASPSRHLGRKVLIVGNLFGREMGNEFYMVLPKLLHGFIRLGCNVHVFNDREVSRGSTPLLRSAAGRGAANRKLLKTCDNFRPDLLLLGHCEVIDNATFEAIRAAHPQARFALRNIDAITDARNRARVRHRAEVVDAIFLTVAAPLHGVSPESRARVYFMPNPVDPAIDIGRGFARSDQAHDLFFAAGGRGGDARLALVEAALARLPGLRADIRGGDNHPPPMRGAGYLEAMADARMGLSISRPDNLYLYASDRMSQLLGNGLLTFVSRASGFQNLFGEDEIAFYEGLEELVEKLDHFAGDDAARRKAAEAGWRAAHSMFASHRVAQYILERSFDEPLSETYPWPTAIDTAPEARDSRSRPPRSSTAS